jgi:5'-methylthioadenosine phosphorylase
MTTCPEVVLAKELGIPYASIAIVTDYDCWREHADDTEHVDVESVLKVFRSSLGKVTNLIVDLVPRLVAYEGWQEVIESNEKMIKSSLL